MSVVLSQFARSLGTDFTIPGILGHLASEIVTVLPVTAAGVTLVTAELSPRYVAASDGCALAYEQLQTELREGPCIAAYTSGEAVLVPDLSQDDRFPTFASRARAEGLAAVFTFPLRHGDHRLGALDLYRTTTGPLDDTAMTAAQTLADVAAAYLLNAQAKADLQDASERYRELCLHDALTGLPNRSLLLERLQHAILRCRRSDKMVALLFVDLDRFKSVNDTFGHRSGDELLIAVAERVTGLLRPGDTLARLAGDEFAILCEDLDEASQVHGLAARVDAGFAEPFVLTSTDVRVSASIGIAFAGPGDDVPERVLQDADTAMYQIKRSGGARHGVVDLREKQLASARVSLSRDLVGALDRGELRAEYQPLVETASGRICGAEALLRWDHPTLGLVSPLAAITLAEHSGLIGEIGRWVLHQACVERRRWITDGAAAELTVAVNVSTHQLMAPDFVGMVADTLAATGTDPLALILEVTESAFIQDTERAVTVLEELKAIGVLLALDDFGTGYSSLSRLKQFPVDILKIDRAFVADLGQDPESSHIVSAIVSLAHCLHMRVVAEGVETTGQREEIHRLDCDIYQGFHFAPSLSGEQLKSLISGMPREPVPAF